MSFFYSLPLRLRAKAARTSKRRRGLGIPFDDYYRGLCHVSCRTTSRTIVVYIHVHGRGISSLPSARRRASERERESEREKGRDIGPPADTRARPCISRRFGRAGHYRRRRIKANRGNRPGHLLFAAERESFINLRARTTYSREQKALCHLALAAGGRAPDAAESESPVVLLRVRQIISRNRAGARMEIAGESISRDRFSPRETLSATRRVLTSRRADFDRTAN